MARQSQDCLQPFQKMDNVLLFFLDLLDVLNFIVNSLYVKFSIVQYIAVVLSTQLALRAYHILAQNNIARMMRVY